MVFNSIYSLKPHVYQITKIKWIIIQWWEIEYEHTYVNYDMQRNLLRYSMYMQHRLRVYTCIDSKIMQLSHSHIAVFVLDLLSKFTNLNILGLWNWFLELIFYAQVKGTIQNELKLIFYIIIIIHVQILWYLTTFL